MARGRKKLVNISLEEQLEAIERQIEETEMSLKDLRQKRKEIEEKIKEEKKEELYKAVLASGKSIDEILAVIAEDQDCE
ncbi:MAG: flagellar export protein FliJ [Eubacteriales bacterium]|nr:flagellar export protein FliJ [Eubacteriales bacterium]